MKRYWVILLWVLLIGCPSNRGTDAPWAGPQDSLAHYLALAKEKQVPLPLQMANIQKALAFSDGDTADSLTLQAHYQKNLLHFRLGQYDSLLANGPRFEALAATAYQHRLLQQHHYLLGYYHAEIGHVYDSAVVHYAKAKEQALINKDSSGIATNLLNIAVLQKNQNDFFGSKESLTEAIAFMRTDRDSASLADAYNTLATNHRKLLNLADAEHYYQKAIATTPSALYKRLYQNNLAASLMDAQQYERAIALLRSLAQDTLVQQGPLAYAAVLDNLAYAQWRHGETVTEAEFQKPLQIKKNEKDVRGQIASYTRLGEYHSAARPQKAMAYFDTVVRLARKLDIPRAERDVLKLVMSLKPTDVATRDRYVQLQDSLYAAELKVKTQFAKYKYDDAQKQASILRLENENAQKALENSRQRNQKLRFMGGLLFSLLLLGFVIYSSGERNKRLAQENRLAKLEATYATEAELSRKLHDAFGAKLNHAMVLLQNGTDTEEVLQLMDDLYGLSRDMSREINDVDTGPRFKETLLAMMGNYCQQTKLIVTGSMDVDWEQLGLLSKKTLYKMLQELMINMRKHSKASLVSVAFQQTGKHLQIQYTDNGVGATPEALHVKNGLWNTEKRIEAIGGSLIFGSEQGQGFEARMTLPL